MIIKRKHKKPKFLKFFFPTKQKPRKKKNKQTNLTDLTCVVQSKKHKVHQAKFQL